MTTPHQATERRALVCSLVATALLSVLGVVWGVAIGSQMILFDGIFGLVGVVTSAMLLQASSLAERAPSRHYHYGQHSATPLVIGIQGFVLLATFAYAAMEAVTSIRHGGSHFSPDVALPYGVVAAMASILFASWLRRRTLHSDLVRAESTAWLVGGLRGAGMVAGFALMLLLDGSAWDGAVPYIDPAMVLLTCVLFIRPPLQMVRSTMHELLEGAPDPEVQAPVHEVITAVKREFKIEEPTIRINKIGPKLYVEVEAHVDPGMTVLQEHQIRTVLEARLKALPYDIWLYMDLFPQSQFVDASEDAAHTPAHEH
jgi:cation diffusion facilitator family transporter